MICTIKREVPALLQEDFATLHDVPDQLWDGHGFLVSVILVISLISVSVIAIFGLNCLTSKKPATTSALLFEQALLGATPSPAK